MKTKLAAVMRIVVTLLALLGQLSAQDKTQASPKRSSAQPVRTKPDADNRPVTKAPWTIPVRVINYFPLTADKNSIDIRVTSNVDAPLAEIAARCERQSQETIEALEQGSRFRTYRNARAQPSLRYKVLDTITFFEPLPHHPKKKNYADDHKIMERVNIADWVEKKRVREVWIWGYHSKEIAPVEYVETDIEDWKPEGFGRKKKMNCDRWGGNDLTWYVYWMQAIPGANNGLTFKGRKLSNWWEFIGDYDQAVRRQSKLTD